MCYGESVVQIGIGNGPSVTVRALVVDGDLLGYDLLLGLNAIRQLDGMAMSDTNEVKIPLRERLMCAAITLDKPDFHAEYDEAKRVWTASWKWSGNQPPVSLKTGSQNILPLSNSKVNMSRSCRLWFRKAAIVDLRPAYLQIHIDKSL